MSLYCTSRKTQMPACIYMYKNIYIYGLAVLQGIKGRNAVPWGLPSRDTQGNRPGSFLLLLKVVFLFLGSL